MYIQPNICIWVLAESRLVLPKTRTVRVRVPHPHSAGAARTQISYFRGTGHSKKINFERKKIKKIFF